MTVVDALIEYLLLAFPEALAGDLVTLVDSVLAIGHFVHRKLICCSRSSSHGLVQLRSTPDENGVFAERALLHNAAVNHATLVASARNTRSLA